MKQIICKTKVLNAKGSSCFQYDETLVYCTVNGFHESKSPGKLNVEIAWNDDKLAERPKSPDYISYIIDNILKHIINYDDKTFENKTLLLTVNVISFSDYIVMCVMNAVVLAFVDFGIPIKMCYNGGSAATFHTKYGKMLRYNTFTLDPIDVDTLNAIALAMDNCVSSYDNILKYDE